MSAEGESLLLLSHTWGGHSRDGHLERSQESPAGEPAAQDSRTDTAGARPFGGAEPAGYVRYHGPPAHCSPSATVHVQRLVCQSPDSMAVCLGSC